MNKQRLIILIIALLGMLAVFMPWITLPIIGPVNGARGNGWIILGLYAIPVIITLLGDRTKSLKGLALYGVIAPGLIATILGIWKIIEFNNSMAGPEENPFAEAMGDAISIGFGLYIVLLAGIAIAASAFVFNDKAKEK